MKIPGVLLAGVPGAGGYDAVFAVTLRELARDKVIEEWNSKGVLTLPTFEDPCGVSLHEADPRVNQVGTSLEAMSLV
jgi:phosphomevalonate kinase